MFTQIETPQTGMRLRPFACRLISLPWLDPAGAGATAGSAAPLGAA
jgi:hypothetical protein